MSTGATPILQPLEDWPNWVPAPPLTDLIFDDGEPLESARHRLAMNTLIRSAKQFLLPQRSCFIGGNMFVYYSTRQMKNPDALGLWLGLWEGAVEDDRTIWLRFFDADGNLVLLPEEQAQQEAEEERQRAEQAEQQLAELMVRLRERGIDPNTL